MACIAQRRAARGIFPSAANGTTAPHAVKSRHGHSSGHALHTPHPTPHTLHPAPRACSKSFPVCASATNGQDCDTHRSQNCPSWQGMQHRAWSSAALPEGLLCKKQHLPCGKCSPGSTSVFVPCSVFRALRLAATAFAEQRTRCEDFEQALGLGQQHALLSHGPCRLWDLLELARALSRFLVLSCACSIAANIASATVGITQGVCKQAPCTQKTDATEQAWKAQRPLPLPSARCAPYNPIQLPCHPPTSH